MRLILALLLALCTCLSGCIAGRIRGNLTTFHELPGSVQGARYAIVPSKGQADSLEFRTYVPYLRAELNKKGMVEAAPADAQYHIYLTYDLGKGTTVNESVPLFGQTGGGTSYISGSAYGSRGNLISYSGSVYTPPTFGMVGAISRTSTYYQQTVNVDFVDTQKSRDAGKAITVCELRMVGSDRMSSVARVMPLMLERMFYDFPAKSGSSKSYMIMIPFD